MRQLPAGRSPYVKIYMRGARPSGTRLRQSSPTGAGVGCQCGPNAYVDLGKLPKAPCSQRMSLAQPLLAPAGADALHQAEQLEQRGPHRADADELQDVALQALEAVGPKEPAVEKCGHAHSNDDPKSITREATRPVAQLLRCGPHAVAHGAVRRAARTTECILRWRHPKILERSSVRQC